jgi:hypothetical protein
MRTPGPPQGRLSRRRTALPLFGLALETTSQGSRPPRFSDVCAKPRFGRAAHQTLFGRAERSAFIVGGDPPAGVHVLRLS